MVHQKSATFEHFNHIERVPNLVGHKMGMDMVKSQPGIYLSTLFKKFIYISTASLYMNLYVHSFMNRYI